MTKDEALRLALEALEEIGLKWPNVLEAIDALRLVIDAQNMASKSTYKEQVETKDEPVAWGMKKDGIILDVICPDEHEREEGGYTVPLYTITPQQEVKNETAQQRINKLPLNDSFWDIDACKEYAKQLRDKNRANTAEHAAEAIEYLLTTQQRKPLTDEQIHEMWSQHCIEWKRINKILINPIVFARAIEAAHGIKE